MASIRADMRQRCSTSSAACATDLSQPAVAQHVSRDTVVSVEIELSDAQGVQLHAPPPVTYLHGGYGGVLEGVENALEGKLPGESVHVQLEPEEAFGDYDAE